MTLTPERRAEIEALRKSLTPDSNGSTWWFTRETMNWPPAWRVFFRAAPTIVDELLAALTECEARLAAIRAALAKLDA